MLIVDELVNTNSALSMLSTAMYGRLPNVRAIQPFTEAATVVIGVGGASGELRTYIDAPVKLDNIVVHHLLLVVDKLAFALFIGMDILSPHGVMFRFGDISLRLSRRLCDVCLDQKQKALSKPRYARLNVYDCVCFASCIATASVRTHSQLQSLPP